MTKDGKTEISKKCNISELRAWSSVSALVALEGLKPQCLCDTTEETVSHKPPFSCYLTPAAVLSADYTKVVCSVDFFFFLLAVTKNQQCNRYINIYLMLKYLLSLLMITNMAYKSIKTMFKLYLESKTAVSKQESYLHFFKKSVVPSKL